MAKATAMKPGSGGGAIQNAKAQSKQSQSYGKGKSAAKFPAKKPGAVNDKTLPRKALAAKKGK